MLSNQERAANLVGRPSNAGLGVTYIDSWLREPKQDCGAKHRADKMIRTDHACAQNRRLGS